MEGPVIECGAAPCGEGPCGSLEVLQQLQELYQQRMEALQRLPGHTGLQKQVALLRSWVGDVVAQNRLLVAAVQDLETEATDLLLQHRRHSEMVVELRAECVVLRRRLARSAADQRALLELLRRLRDGDPADSAIHFHHITADDIFGDAHTEIKEMRKKMQQHEQTIANLRSEISMAKYHTPDVSKKDAEVMAVFSGAECGDWEPVKDYNYELREVVSYQERIRSVDEKLTASHGSVQLLRSNNLELRVEVLRVQAACAALTETAHALHRRALLQEDIIWHLRRALRRLKGKSKSAAEVLSGASSAAAVDDCSPRLVYSHEDIAAATRA